MKIVQEDGGFVLKWTYSIKNNRTIKNEKEYYFYNTIFPAELVDYFGSEELWLYNTGGHTYITKEEPPYPNSRRFKLFSKNKNQLAKDFTLSKKFFKELEGYCEGQVVYLFRLDGSDELIGGRGLLEICVVLD